MKFAIVILTYCLLGVVGTIVFAPEYAHEIIDKLHEHSTNTHKSHVIESNEENNNHQANEDSDTEKVLLPQDNPIENRGIPFLHQIKKTVLPVLYQSNIRVHGTRC